MGAAEQRVRPRSQQRGWLRRYHLALPCWFDKHPLHSFPLRTRERPRYAWFDPPREGMLMFAKLLRAGSLALAASLFAPPVSAQSTSGSTLIVAEPFEPQTLDPTTNTIDLITTITQNVFEPLYAFDRNWQPAPILASEPAKIADDAKTITIPL